MGQGESCHCRGAAGLSAGLAGGEETKGSERRHKRCPRALARLLPPIALLKFVLPLPNPGWALQGGDTAGSVNGGQMFSEERVHLCFHSHCSQCR